MNFFRWKGCGSFTVEGTVIISLICLSIGLVVMVGFYGHDRALLQSTADELALYGSLWEGRYAHPKIREVDYETMKREGTVSHETIEAEGYRMLAGRLFCGEIQEINVSKSLSGKELQIEIQSDFQLGKYSVPCTVRASSMVLKSKDLPRKGHQAQEEETDES